MFAPSSVLATDDGADIADLARDIEPPHRLRIDAGALAENWRSLARLSRPAVCGAAVKADGYGVGAKITVLTLSRAGCRDFFVATWQEAAALAKFGQSLSVFHGVRREEMDLARRGFAKPVLNTAAQVVRWREAAGGPCDVMVDTGMNRLGVSIRDVTHGLLDGLDVDTVMSHLACADQDSPINDKQLAVFRALRGRVSARRFSLANSAGIALGRHYHFDMTRPGLAIYGGAPRPDLAPYLRQVVFPEAQILQRRKVRAGQIVGYNAAFVAECDLDVALINLGYADGLTRRIGEFSSATKNGKRLPVVGRASMDLTAIDISQAPELEEGDWVTLDFDVAELSRRSSTSQYEILTGLGRRVPRVTDDTGCESRSA